MVDFGHGCGLIKRKLCCKGEFIFRLYNLIKKKIIRVNNVHFVEKRPLIVNLEEKTNAHKSPIKR